jgi:hypothetical protein
MAEERVGTWQLPHMLGRARRQVNEQQQLKEHFNPGYVYIQCHRHTPALVTWGCFHA